MSILIHLITSIILSAFLYFYFGWLSLLVFIGGVLIDIDHYFSYVARLKEINILNGYSYYKGREVWGILCIFHTFEFMFVMIVVSFFL